MDSNQELASLSLTVVRESVPVVQSSREVGIASQTRRHAFSALTSSTCWKLCALAVFLTGVDRNLLVASAAQVTGNLIDRFRTPMDARSLEEFEVGIQTILLKPLAALPSLKRLSTALAQKEHPPALQALVPLTPTLFRTLTVG